MSFCNNCNVIEFTTGLFQIFLHDMHTVCNLTVHIYLLAVAVIISVTLLFAYFVMLCLL